MAGQATFLRSVHLDALTEASKHLIWERHVPTVGNELVTVKLVAVVESDWHKQVHLEIEGTDTATVVTARSPEEALQLRNAFRDMHEVTVNRNAPAGIQAQLNAVSWDANARVLTFTALTDEGTVQVVSVPIAGAPRLCAQISEEIDRFVFLRHGCI